MSNDITITIEEIKKILLAAKIVIYLSIKKEISSLQSDLSLYNENVSITTNK